MEQAWSFRRGNWSDVTSPVGFVDAAGEQLEEVEGYEAETLWLGLEGGFQVEVYTRVKGNTKALSPYLAILYLGGDNREYVYIEDLPSLMQFLNMVAPIIQCSNEDIEASGELGDDWDEEEDDESGNGDHFR